MTSTAKVFLIPVPIDEDAIDTLPSATLDVLYQIQHFIAERGKTARHYLKVLGHPKPQSEINVLEIPKHGTLEYQEIKQWLDNGHPIGILSESGCPGIADPGAEVVSWAHKNGYMVEPLVGPSSILLGLMASGFSGQSFVFHGYLPNKKDDLVKKLKTLEANATRFNQSQIFIETPYRNGKFFEILIQTLHNTTKLSIQSGLTGKHAYSKTLTIRQWHEAKDIGLSNNIPAVFIIG
ncbi:MAG: SAM-dependent methyltransferase [Saprospiraceae bacterium]|nr:SAM-dependent methyltransferase [Saprospiraceae bacterium]